MALGDILAARADNARARGTVEVGALGTVEVEALPIRELERLWYGIDRDRVVFYAACRALQREGAALLRAGRNSAGAGEAADTGASSETSDRTAGEAAAHGTDTDKKAASPAVTSNRRAPDNGRPRGQRFDYTADGTDEGAGGQDSHETDKEAEIRPAVVQENAEEREVRRDTVRKNATAFEKIRRSSVQSENGNGQVSREFLTENAGAGNRESKTQVLPENAADAPQNVGVPDESDTGLPESGVSFSEESTGHGNGKTTDLHEIESESGVEMHEIRSETAQSVHESESDFSAEEAGTMHEMKSDLGAERGEEPHEMKSELTKTVHETTSELAERVARELLDGLKRAAWVR